MVRKEVLEGERNGEFVEPEPSIGQGPRTLQQELLEWVAGTVRDRGSAHGTDGVYPELDAVQTIGSHERIVEHLAREAVQRL